MSDPTHISAWLRIDARLTTSGQPSDAELAALPPLGVGHVINLGLHSHERALPDEAASVSRLGMAYVHIPVAFDAPTEADFSRFCTAMAAIGDARALHRQRPCVGISLSLSPRCARAGRTTSSGGASRNLASRRHLGGFHR